LFCLVQNYNRWYSLLDLVYIAAENVQCLMLLASLCNTLSFLADIESKLRQIEEDPEGAGTAHLYAVTQKISGVANRAFEPLFERQVKRLISISNNYSLSLALLLYHSFLSTLKYIS
jgi:hypothetical protein